jgi:hypothetical protein
MDHIEADSLARSRSDFLVALEAKVAEQLQAQRVGYLLGAGSSYLAGEGYPLSFELWERIKEKIDDPASRTAIQEKLDGGASGIEQALDLLDDGGAKDIPLRHVVTTALAELFMPMTPTLDIHIEFVRRIARRAAPWVKVFSLNYDPLVELAAAQSRIRLTDGFLGAERCYFEAAVFEERIGRLRGSHRGKQFDETVKPIHLLKLHGSLGWYECPAEGVRRGSFGSPPPSGTKRLMIPPQRRKAADTMLQPYAALWSTFRGSLAQDAIQLNRLACIGYGFGDEHVNSVIEAALGRSDFTVLIFTKELSDPAWLRWSAKRSSVIVTRSRSSIKGQTGPGHPDLWSFERLAKEV